MTARLNATASAQAATPLQSQGRLRPSSASANSATNDTLQVEVCCRVLLRDYDRLRKAAEAHSLCRDAVKQVHALASCTPVLHPPALACCCGRKGS